MTTMLSSRHPDVIHPLPRAALPFRIENGPAGPELVWEEMIQHRYTQEVVRLPVRFGGNNVISWQRLKEPLLEVLRLFRELEQHAEQVGAENERLKIELTQAEGRLRDFDKAERHRKGQKNMMAKEQSNE